jgi:WD40 repeat protein
VLAISPDGRHALSASPLAPTGASLRLWEVATLRQLASMPLTAAVAPAVFLKDSKRAVFADGGELRMLDVEKFEELLPLPGPKGPVTGVTFSHDGRLLLSWGQDDRLRLWDIATGKDLGRFPTPVKTQRVVVSPTNRYALTLGMAKENARLWDIASGKELRILKAHNLDVFDAVFLGDDRHALTLGKDVLHKEGGYDATVRRWDVQTGKQEIVFKVQNFLTGLFAPDGSKVITEFNHKYGDGTAKVHWQDVQKGKILGVLEKPIGIGAGSSVVLSRDASRLYFARDGHVTPCRFQKGKATLEPQYFNLHRDPGISLALSPDGRTLASADQKGHIVVWDTSKGECWCEWDQPSAVNALAFAGDGRHLATANNNGTIGIYRLSPRSEPQRE